VRRIVKRNMVLVYMHEIVKQVAWVGHCSFYTVFLQLTYFCVITFCFLFWNLDSWRLALQSLLSWWRHRDAQDADGWSCRVWRWNSCNRGPGNSHSLQPAPWNQVWALYWKDALFSYANSRWAKMLSHSCHGPRNLRWKRESWYLIATSRQNYLLFWLPSTTRASNCIFHFVILLDGSQMDFPALARSSASCILPAHEVVHLQVSQAGPWCG